MRRAIQLLPVLAAAALLAAPAAGEPSRQSGQDANGVSLSGTVRSVTSDHFTLKDRDGLLTVRMAGKPWRHADILLPGDRVAVSGRLAADFAESRTIDASSVAIPNLVLAGAPGGDWIAVTGRVEATDGSRLTLRVAGGRTVIVDAGALQSGVGEDAGADGLAVGDRVSVAGTLAETAAARDLRAASIALLPGDPD